MLAMLRMYNNASWVGTVAERRDLLVSQFACGGGPCARSLCLLHTRRWFLLVVCYRVRGLQLRCLCLRHLQLRHLRLKCLVWAEILGLELPGRLLQTLLLSTGLMKRGCLPSLEARCPECSGRGCRGCLVGRPLDAGGWGRAYEVGVWGVLQHWEHLCAKAAHGRVGEPPLMRNVRGIRTDSMHA